MKPAILTIADNFTLPAIDYANQGNACLGIRGSGKSYGASKIAEGLLDAGIPILAFDPTGIWRYLKTGTKGHKGYPVVVAGGEGADIQLRPDNAVAIVEAATKEGVSLVIDLYSPELSNKSAWIKIVHETVQWLLYHNKDYGLRHIFLEEAAEFVPQRIRPEQSRVYDTLERVARVGRNYGVGLTIINQRAAEVNKAVLENCALSLLFKQVGKNSIKSVADWMDGLEVPNAAEVTRGLSRLEPGEAWVVGAHEVPVRIKVLPKKTFHPDPKREAAPAPTAGVADVTAFVAKLTPLLAKAPDVKENSKAGESVGLKAAQGKIKALDEAAAARLRELQDVQAELAHYKRLYSDLVEKMKALADEFGSQVWRVPKEKLEPAAQRTPDQASKVSLPSKARLAKPVTNTVSTRSGAMRMLQAAATFYPGTITKQRMATIAGLSHSAGSFGNNLSMLRQSGYLEDAGVKLYRATSAGVDHIGGAKALPTDPKALVDMWCDIIGATSAPARILRFLAGIYPLVETREGIGAELNLSHTAGSFGNAISKLHKNGLIEKTSAGIKAASELFGK